MVSALWRPSERGNGNHLTVYGLQPLQGFIDSITNSKGRSRQSKDEKPQGSVYILYVKGSLENFEHIMNQYSIIRTIFKTNTLF